MDLHGVPGALGSVKSCAVKKMPLLMGGDIEAHLDPLRHRVEDAPEGLAIARPVPPEIAGRVDSVTPSK